MPTPQAAAAPASTGSPPPQAPGPGPLAAFEQVGVRYGARWALRDISVTFPRGAVGLLGPNGAGKSTMLKALLGFIVPVQGRLELLGQDVSRAPIAIRSRVGYMPENDAYIPGMNAVSFVAYCGRLCGLPAADAMQRAHETLYYTGLEEARYRNVETYSTGMRQRIKLAQALVHDPELLLLDEPTNGLDPRGRDEMLHLIQDLAEAKGFSLILSSHVLPDVEQVCRHVIVIDRGRIATQGSIDELKGPSGRVYEVRIKGDEARFLTMLRDRGIEGHPTPQAVIRAFVPESLPPRELFDVAVAAGVQVRHLRPSVPTLEDVFTRAVGAVEESTGAGERE